MLLCSLLSKGKTASAHSKKEHKATARKNKLKGGVNAFIHFHFPFPQNDDKSESQTSCPGQTCLYKVKAMEIPNVGGSSVSWFLHPELHWGVGDCSKLFIPLAKPLHTMLPQQTSLPSFVPTYFIQHSRRLRKRYKVQD